MASVFGYAKVSEAVTFDANRYIHIVYDDEGNKKLVVCNKILPKGTVLYWEYFIKENKTYWMVIS